MPETISNFFQRKDLYQNAIGSIVEIDTQEDLTTDVDKVELRVKKPGYTGYDEDVWEAQVADITKIKYITKEYDLDVPGFYYIQAIAYYKNGSIIPLGSERINILKSLL